MTFDQTRPRFASSVLFLAAALALAGCTSRAATPPPADMGSVSDEGLLVDEGAPTDAGMAEDMPPALDAGDFDANFPAGTLTINGTLTELTAAGAGGPVVGATVCVIVPVGGPCMTSGADGTFTATGIPAGTEMLVELNAPMYQPALATVTSGAIDVDFAYLMVKRSTVRLLGGALTLAIDATKGQIFVQSGNAAGTTVALAPLSGTGPYYSTAAGLPSPALTETTTSGAAIFANVAPGDYVVTFANATLTCDPTGFSWSGTAPETTKVTVQADHITSTVAFCR